MPSFQDYANAAEDAKKSLPPEWAKYASSYDMNTLQKYAQYADEAKAIIDDPQKAIDMVEDYLVTYLGDAIGVAVGAAAGAAIGTCIPVPVIGTAVGAALGAGVAYLRSLMQNSPWIDRYVDRNGNPMPQVEQTIDEWLGPNPTAPIKTVAQLHSWFHTRDGAVALANPVLGGVQYYIKTELRKAPQPYIVDGKNYPAGSEHAFEMQGRFYFAIENARQEFIQDKVHEAQAHGQITANAVINANKPKVVGLSLSRVAIAASMAVHPAVALGAINLVALANGGDASAKKSIAVIVDGARNGNGSAIASARVLTAAQRQAVRDDFVNYYLQRRNAA